MSDVTGTRRPDVFGVQDFDNRVDAFAELSGGLDAWGARPPKKPDSLATMIFGDSDALPAKHIRPTCVWLIVYFYL